MFNQFLHPQTSVKVLINSIHQTQNIWHLGEPHDVIFKTDKDLIQF